MELRATKRKEYLFRQGLIRLLEIKDKDIRAMCLEQGRDSVDKGIHIGGAFSAIIPMVALFYGGCIRLDIANPTRQGQDMFILSKGHAITPMASIFADIGYFNRSVLENSRSIDSILNGHPGPILPGVHIASGPLGQGVGVAEGLALIGKECPSFDVYALAGDGELQEGSVWEAVMYSSFRNLDNLCLIVDMNCGQVDDVKGLILPLPNLDERFEAFGWRVFNIDGTQYSPILEALLQFKTMPRDGRPTVVISHGIKGYGGCSDVIAGHKITLPDDVCEQELRIQMQKRAGRVCDFLTFFNGLAEGSEEGDVRSELFKVANNMNLEIVINNGNASDVMPVTAPVKTKRASSRNKKIEYDMSKLPKLDKTQVYTCSSIVSAAMRVFAQDPRIVSIDADLASLSGLQAGVSHVDRYRALNVGVAEANMMLIAEAFALTGYNVWASTLGPFFDWKVLRRIAIGYQERLEAIQMTDGWLDEGHGLDITFLAPAANLDTRTNGATHMANDDVQVFSGISHLKIIDISCPQLLLSVMKWIMKGNKGLVYLRIMRQASSVIYDANFGFEYGKGYTIKNSPDDVATIISSGRGVHEAIRAAQELEQIGIISSVADMPSIDKDLLRDIYRSGTLMVIAEQNNGFILPGCREALSELAEPVDFTRLMSINTLDKSGLSQFIHSGTYDQLIRHFGLASDQIAERIRLRVAR